MRTVASNVFRLYGLPAHVINVYLISGILVDAGTPRAGGRILRQLREYDVTAHALTHAHPDHFGSSHEVCEALSLPLWTGARDAEAVETAAPVLPESRVAPLMARMKMPPAHPVARRLREGDEVADFIVLDVPGHSPGHIALWRERDRTLICGDVFFNFPRLGPPPAFMTVDPERNRESMRRLAALQPDLVLFGHGPPLRDPARLARAAE